MPRTKKKMNSYLKLGVIALISGVIGGVCGVALVAGEELLRKLADSVFYGMLEYGWLILSIFFVIYMSGSLILFVRLKTLMRTEMSALGDEQEELAEQIDFLQDLSGVANNIFMAVFFTGFALTITLTHSFSGN